MPHTLACSCSRLRNVEGYHVENFGCRSSQADGDALAAELSRAAGRAVPEGQAALIVLNTCAVTAEAERTARAYLRRVKRENPEAQVVVTGCYAQRAPEEVAQPGRGGRGRREQPQGPSGRNGGTVAASSRSFRRW